MTKPFSFRRWDQVQNKVGFDSSSHTSPFTHYPSLGWHWETGVGKKCCTWAAKKLCIMCVNSWEASLQRSTAPKELPGNAAKQRTSSKRALDYSIGRKDQTCCLKDARREYHSFNAWRKRKRSGQILVCLHTKIIPSWTGFNFLVHNDVSVSQGSIGYLLTLNCPATKMSAVSSFKNMLMVVQSRELSN